uniref:Cytochrome c domain-containing protein n=1 Tax=Anopheles coluzzii TaxID=1518534 RepID=A0A8W7PQR0_ANOCL
LRLAQNEWARFRANGSKECRSCHDYKSMDFEKMRETSREAMRGAAQRNQSCLDCHKGIAHHKPATGNSRNPAFDGLMQAASSVNAKEGAVYYNVFPRTLYLDEALSQTAGKLEIAAAVKVLQEKGDAQQVEITAWRKSKGLWTRLVRPLRQRTSLRPHWKKNVAQDAQRIKVTESREDPNTGLVWQKTSGVFWIRKGEVVEKIEPLWSVARDSYKSSCSVCHKQPDEAHFDANTWPGLFGGMVGFTSMDKDTQALVLKYLQSNASDFKQAGH